MARRGARRSDMSNNTTQVATNTFPFLSILGLLFVTLKLTNYITWSWWFVLMPFYIVPVVLLGIVGVGFLFMLIGVTYEWLVETIPSKDKKVDK